MPTNDEQREAVRFLRTAICTESDCDTCREMSAKLFPPSDDSCFDGHSTLCRLDNEEDGAIWRRLADLIEPTVETCEADMIDVIEARVAVREYECSKCGMSWETVWAYDFSYCPYCGRMIENADE